MQEFQGKPIMVRIKAQTMAVGSFAPQNGPRAVQLGGDAYGSFLPGASYQQPLLPHVNPQQLCDFPPSEVWPSVYPECSEVGETFSQGDTHSHSHSHLQTASVSHASS